MTYEYEPHAPKKRKASPWLVCKRCGLVYLQNEFTRWSIDRGCNNVDHPEYQRRRNAAGVAP